MPRETTGYWTQKVTFDGLWNSIVLEATLVVGDDGQELFWRGKVTSERYRGPFQTIGATGPGVPVDIDAELPDGLRLRGSVSLRTWGTQWILWTPELKYHFEGQEPQLVEGSLIALGNINGGHFPPSPLPPAPPPPPGPVPPEDEPPVVPIVRPSRSREGALFPYQYLRPWPAPSPADLALNFAAFPPRQGATLPDAFLQCLQQLKAKGGPDARLQMEQASVDYLEGLPYEGNSFASAPFVPALSVLPAPFPAYPEARALVAQLSRRQPAAEVLAALRQLVGTPELDSEPYLTALTRCFQSYFALIAELGFDRELRSALADVLVVDHLLVWLSGREESSVRDTDLQSLAAASVLLPFSIFPLPPEGAPAPPASASTIVPYAVGELELVKQRLIRYSLGEIAYVQSVMAGERRRTVQRRASRTLRTSARSSSDTRSTQSEARSLSLAGEVKSALEDAVTTATFKDFSTTYGPPASAPNDPPSTAINGSWTVERGPGTNQGGAPHDASEYARNVLERAAQRMASQVQEARATAALREAEETTTSELENVAGVTGRRGIFRWLNEVYEAFVVNYGSRLVLEVVLASPAAAYVHAELELPGKSAPPVPLSALGIDSYADLTREAFPALSARYPSEALTLPPPLQRSISGWARSGEPLSLPLPEGYASTELRVGYVVAPGQGTLVITGVVGQKALSLSETASGVASQPLLGETGSVLALLHTVVTPPPPPGSAPSPAGTSALAPVPLPPIPGDLSPVQLAVAIDATPTDACFAEWQLRTFQAFQASYEAQLEAYRGVEPGASSSTPEPRASTQAVPPRALKQGTVALLFQTQLAHVGSAGPGPEVGRPRYLQFFERAFEWDEMSYSFLLDPSVQRKLSSGDDRYQDFLSAAFAQVLLPVSPREALPVCFFLASGMLWDGAGDLAPVHEADAALALAVKKLRQTPPDPQRVGEPWEVIVPTTAAVLQDGDGSLRDLAAVRVDLRGEES